VTQRYFVPGQLIENTFLMPGDIMSSSKFFLIANRLFPGLKKNFCSFFVFAFALQAHSLGTKFHYFVIGFKFH
jgi:hypothetical protein